MLLRSLAKHIKEQNWFAVFIDFFIVVLGILLAFQITEWSEQQADKRALHVALERLEDEIQGNILAIDKYSQRHEDIASAGQALLKLVRDPALGHVPMALIAKVFLDGYTTNYSTSALMSVLNQQTFQGLQSNELRPAVSALPAEYLDASEDEHTVIQRVDGHWNPYISQYLPAGPMWINANKDTEWEAYFAATEGFAEYEVVSLSEFKVLAASLPFQNEIINRIGYERLILIEQQELRLFLEQVLALIEEETP
ncbi:hypothetical protein [Aliiglaciecola litoralis]|uniref:Uncharacterized protein n=1 Tax=Aliiglaciecola litoralis TaxID=582857 RepID=A0ABN1LDT4_9ALTE